MKSRLVKQLAAVAVLLLSLHLGLYAEQIQETNFVFGGLPKLTKVSGSEDILVLTNRGYIVGYSETRKNPRWVCYKLSKVGEVGKAAANPERKNNFRADTRTKPPQVGPDAFEKLPYDRGHMAPSYGIGTRYGAIAQDETFLMSNMCPQAPSLNRGIWKNLEKKEADDFANGYGQVWIITGPIFSSNPKRIGKYGVEEPTAYFKIIVDKRDDAKARVLPFKIESTTTSTKNLNAFLTSVKSLEKLTGLDFFEQLPVQEQEELEKQKPSSIWKFAIEKKK